MCIKARPAGTKNVRHHEQLAIFISAVSQLQSVSLCGHCRVTVVEIVLS